MTAPTPPGGTPMGPISRDSYQQGAPHQHPTRNPLLRKPYHGGYPGGLPQLGIYRLWAHHERVREWLSRGGGDPSELMGRWLFWDLVEEVGSGDANPDED